jgi:hypothetical protein
MCKGGIMNRAISMTKALVFVILASQLIFIASGCDGEKESGKAVGIKPLSEFKAGIIVEKPPAVLRANALSTIKVRVKNLGNAVWPAGSLPDGTLGVRLCYHWLNKEGKMVVFDGLRTFFPHDLKPNEEIVLDAKVSAPNQAGDYILEFDMVQEAVAWFKDKGSQTARIKVALKR